MIGINKEKHGMGWMRRALNITIAACDLSPPGAPPRWRISSVTCAPPQPLTCVACLRRLNVVVGVVLFAGVSRINAYINALPRLIVRRAPLPRRTLDATQCCRLMSHRARRRATNCCA